MDINRTAEVLSDFLVSSEKKIPRESEFTPNPDYSAENIAGMMNIQIDMRMQAFGTEDEPATIIPKQLRSDLDLMRSNYESMEEILSSVNDFAEMESLANDTNPLDTNWELRSAAAQFNEYLNANKADIERAEALLDPNQTREVPGAYDQAEREADEAEHERIISDMRGENENMIPIAVYKDTTGLYTQEEIDEDNIAELYFPESIVKDFVAAGGFSDDFTFFATYTADNTFGLVDFARERGFEVSRGESELSFAEQVDKALNNQFARYDNSDLKISNTPDILLKIGCEQLPILYTRNHLKEAIRPKNEHTHAHGLTTDLIKQIPIELEKPVMVFDSQSRNDSIVVVTSLTDSDNLPVIVSIKPNGHGVYELQNVDSNFATSIYGREGFESLLERVIANNDVLYCDQQKSQDLFSVLGLQSSEGFNNLDFNIIIHQSRNISRENQDISADIFPRLNETKEDALADRIDRLAYDMYRNNAESLLFPLNKEEIVNALESGNIEDITVPLANMQGLVDEDERREVFKAVREYSDRPIMLLTGQAIGEKMQDVLNRLDSGEYVKLEEIMQIPEIQLAETKKSAVPEKVIHSDEEIAAAIDKLSKYGSATVDADGKISYNGDVEKGSRLDVIIGLPASGKSSAILDDISKEFKSKLIDSDEAKKMFKEFNHGWGANAVHSDSQLVEQGAFLKAVENHENIVLPKVGSDADDLIKQYLTLAEKNDYTINIHYVDLEREKSLGRMLRRFIDQGRYLEPKLIDKYNNEIDGNKIEQTYDKFKSDPQYSKYVDGMSRWDNDVNKGEKPILIEAENLSGTYIENARTHEKGAEKDETRNGFEKSSRESSTGISADGGNGGESRQSGSESRGSISENGHEQNDNIGVGKEDASLLRRTGLSAEENRTLTLSIGDSSDKIASAIENFAELKGTFNVSFKNDRNEIVSKFSVLDMNLKDRIENPSIPMVVDISNEGVEKYGITLSEAAQEMSDYVEISIDKTKETITSGLSAEEIEKRTSMPPIDAEKPGAVGRIGGIDIPAPPDQPITTDKAAMKDEGSANRVNPEKLLGDYDRMVDYLSTGKIREPQITPAKPVSQDRIKASASSKNVSEPFKANDGNEYVRVMIPNKDRNDDSPWASIVVKPEQVSDAAKGIKSIDFRATGTVTVYKGERQPDGSFINNKFKLSTAEVKEWLDKTAPKSIGKLLAANKEKSKVINEQHKQEQNRTKNTDKNRGGDGIG